MDRVDNRKLDKCDAYLRCIGRPGVYHYRINYLSEGMGEFEAGPEYEIVVEAFKGKETIRKPEEVKQHDIQVVYDAKLRYFHAKPARLDIIAGDLVLWHKPSKEGGAFSVSGFSEDGDTFDSRRLGYATVYMHNFLESGTYNYTNTYGRGGSQSGTVKVVPIGKDYEEWLERLKKPAVVNYVKGAFTPSKVEVVQGGAVMWVVQDDVKISVVVKARRRPGKIVKVAVGRVRPAKSHLTAKYTKHLRSI